MTSPIKLGPISFPRRVHMFPKSFPQRKHVFKVLASALQSRPTMNLKLLLMVLVAAAPAAAQTGVQPPKGWSLGIFVGGAAFTDFQREDVRSVGVTASGRPF